MKCGKEVWEHHGERPKDPHNPEKDQWGRDKVSYSRVKRCGQVATYLEVFSTGAVLPVCLEHLIEDGTTRVFSIPDLEF